jgi:hypothetical protein
MNTVNFSRRVPAKTIEADIDSFHSMNFIKNYIPVRSEATPEALKAGYETMRAKQQQETELLRSKPPPMRPAWQKSSFTTW